MPGLAFRERGRRLAQRGHSILSPLLISKEEKILQSRLFQHLKEASLCVCVCV